MKILLLGATGMIGTRIKVEASSRNHEILAASRSAPADDDPRVTPLSLDLANSEALRDAVAKTDVVVSAVSPRSSDDTMVEALAYIDALIGAVGTKRLVLVGGAGSLDLPDGNPVADVVPEPYTQEAKAMRAATEKLAASALDFTVIAPPSLIAPGERTGAYRSGGRVLLTDSQGNSAISAEDYAVALMDEVETPKHKGQLFTVISA
ncbi:NAD(P)-dependent oxidoreductase [Neptunicoccus cionae]|uniref:NAD(P)-dependent oxidoreductase n=1 Tax=Neptunicoccus cionae TaxID=2035344 RepID=UPI000C78F97D|nr:NAD(P)H-binding protein [Amylibacter cionae]PLS22253.1 hypothetical protein C0U40_07455 [Amylibacter cionae]